MAQSALAEQRELPARAAPEPTLDLETMDRPTYRLILILCDMCGIPLRLIAPNKRLSEAWSEYLLGRLRQAQQMCEERNVSLGDVLDQYAKLVWRLPK